MALMNIARGNIDRSALGENVNASCYLPEKVVEFADELAREFGVSRTYVIREFCIFGYNQTLDHWEHAHDQGAKKAKRGKK